ncbi:DUF3231 family protein [Niallia sp. Krafla_26]|uniref:DUF3231 family protein n=1 Tax=Niallia sp. Krafla_26 TaxID=3064703 RepID=UPI003D17F4EE
MKDKNKLPFTAAEISGLWMQYMNDTVARCINQYFLETVEDEEVRPIIQWTLDIAKGNLSIMEEIFNREEYPIPLGFTDRDVNVKAPKLVSDTLMLQYLKNMSILAMAASSSSLGIVTRPELVSLFKRIQEKANMLQDLTRELMLKQGIYAKTPSLVKPDHIDFAKRQEYLTGFFGNKRPLSAIEITHLFINLQSNSIGKALVTAFAQTAQNEDVKQYFLRGKKLAQKHIDLFGHFLTKADLPIPTGSDSEISNSTTPVFSDKLMLFHIGAMTATGMSYYGTAMGASPRRDLGLRYASLLPDLLLFAEDGANLMIKYGWFEEPPQAEDRDRLIQRK